MNWIGIFFYSSNRHDHRIWLASQVTKKKKYESLMMLQWDDYWWWSSSSLINRWANAISLSFCLEFLFLSLSLSLFIETKQNDDEKQQQLKKRYSNVIHVDDMVVSLLFTCWFLSVDFARYFTLTKSSYIEWMFFWFLDKRIFSKKSFRI